MRTVVIEDAVEFARLVTPVLEQFEAENNLALGIISTVAAGKHHGQTLLLAVVHSTSVMSTRTLEAVVVRTPPFPVVVGFTAGASGPVAVQCVVDTLRERYGTDIRGFNADARIVRPYVDAWSQWTGARASVHMRTRIYRCTRVRHPVSVPGRARRFEERDRDVVRRFLTGFYHDAVPDEYDPRRIEAYLQAMSAADPARQGLLLWEHDGEAVSMAAYSGPTPHGIRVNAVYTPNEHRRHGYASACVAELTERLLRAGREFCFLFTDLSNPTSNRIYQEIGYEPVSDHLYWTFSP